MSWLFFRRRFVPAEKIVPKNAVTLRDRRVSAHYRQRTASTERVAASVSLSGVESIARETRAAAACDAMSSPQTATSHPEPTLPFRPRTEMAQPAAVAFPEPVKEAAVAEPSTVSSTSLPSAKKARVDTSPLEGVRALACAIIAANHWLLWYGEKRHGAIELQGGFAVTVFFFITGFVMYLAYGDKACREDFKYWVRTRVVSETLLDARRVLPERDASASDARL